MRHWVDAEAVRLLQLRTRVLRAQGAAPAPAASLGKLAVSTDRPPAGGMGAGAPWARPREHCSRRGYPPADARGARRPRPAGGSVVGACIASPGMAIAGGTDQIQRNIIGERVLGLPPEPKVDRTGRDPHRDQAGSDQAEGLTDADRPPLEWWPGRARPRRCVRHYFDWRKQLMPACRRT